LSGVESASITRLRGPILRSVSRSFYLSIRLLPTKLRDPIALAYLLARATDTIADTAEISAAIRAEQLARLAQLIQQDGAASAEAFREFAALQKNDDEQVLIESLPACFHWLAEMPAADRADIRKVLQAINEGQTLDVQRFGNARAVVALASAAELDRYTYLVAGCVGEFWTTTCFRHLRSFSSGTEQTMIDRGIAYGKGLQLVNILRDVGADLRAGRCYLPAEELHSLGISAADLSANPAAAEPVFARWRERAEEGIGAGIEYACAIRSPRVRLATALPALIGARTLALLKNAGSAVLTEKIKVPRAEVRQILLRTTASLASPRVLRRMFAHALSS
jgi:farnesyl-diphosphate farnesyltransferase